MFVYETETWCFSGIWLVGLPICCLTKSSDENHNAIMLRCARLSDDDPYFRNCNADMQRMYGRQYPPLVDWDKQSRAMLPDYEVRRRVLCHSAVSAVDGFKIHTRLSFKYIYGMRLCMQCPRCEHSKEPDSFCQDAEGLSTEIEGGSLGRTLTIVGTSEFQKSATSTSIIRPWSSVCTHRPRCIQFRRSWTSRAHIWFRSTRTTSTTLACINTRMMLSQFRSARSLMRLLGPRMEQTVVFPVCPLISGAALSLHSVSRSPSQKVAPGSDSTSKT